jgi:predicted transcriptional regulator
MVKSGATEKVFSSPPDSISTLSEKHTPANFDRFFDIMSILSKKDAMTIFTMAKEGLRSELDTPGIIGLTKKQYYTRMKQLVDLNLLTKTSRGYEHTSLGSVIYQNHVIGLLKNMENYKTFEVMDVLKKSSKFNQDDINEFMTKMGIGTLKESHSETGLVLITQYEHMVTKVLEMITFAQKEILLSTRFLNDLIVNANLKKSSSGIPVRVLTDTKLVKEYFNTEGKKIQNDKNMNERINVVSNPYYPSNVERRYVDVPYSMIIVDDNKVGLEIIDNYNPAKFNMVVFSDDSGLAESLKDKFYNLWDMATPNIPKPITERK